MVNANLLKSKIMAAGYTQLNLAPVAGLSPNSLNAKINGRKKFNIDEVETLCTLLGINDPVEKCNIFLSNISQ